MPCWEVRGLVGGVERMVLSLTVILMEATCNVRFGLPLLVTLIFARWVGTSVSLSLRDAYVHVQHHIQVTSSFMNP